ncbi:uncharacterized protein BDV17DRAFT_294463 [Aspergillus undulatus]|uniref:uncharacterized protein n=1 Tax=Aspergillus undulatus TaxID=1810928 RepID=UPI003CCDB237
MEKKRPLSPNCGIDGPHKKSRTGKDNIVYDNREHTSRHAKKALGLNASRHCAGVKSDKYNTPWKRDTVLKERTPYTERFFSNLAKTITDTFPFKEFARDNHCEIEDVVLAIREVVVKPLSKPFKLQKDPNTSAAEGTEKSTKSPHTPVSVGAETITSQPTEAGIPLVKPQVILGRPTIRRVSLTTQTPEPINHKGALVKQTKANVPNAKPTNTGFSPFKIPGSNPDETKRRSSVSADTSPVKQGVFSSKYVTMRSKRDGRHRTPVPEN